MKHVLLALCIIALSACASKVRLDDLPPVTGGTSPSESISGGTRGTAATNAGNTTGSTNSGLGIASSATGSAIATVQAGNNDTNQPTAAQLAKRSVYFDYDSFTIRDEGKPVLQAHAKHLSANRNLKIALEGHTDERGGGEYNLALGQKRANAVQEALQLLGVPASQMEAVSFGKEKPKALGSDEAGYAENRRVDIQYK